jgi:hypothetical protein
MFKEPQRNILFIAVLVLTRQGLIVPTLIKIAQKARHNPEGHYGPGSVRPSCDNALIRHWSFYAIDFPLWWRKISNTENQLRLTSNFTIATLTTSAA